MKIRNISELLQLMLDNFDEYYKGGLSYLAYELYCNRIITNDEWDIIERYLRDFGKEVRDPNKHYFLISKKRSRIKWLKEHIEITKQIGNKMKAEELRVGNMVTHRGFDIFRVDEIRQTNEGCVIRMYPCDNLESKMDMFLSTAEPIPLTPELLKKCGFNRARRVEGLTLHGIDLVVTTGGSIFANRTGVEIKFLHQLQNYVFALAGKELEVKF